MSAKLEELEYFYGIDQMDRAFGDTSGRIAAMHLGFSPKKPDKSKVSTLLEKGKSGTSAAQGKFFLVLDGLKLTFEVRVGTNKIVLNTLDLAGVKDLSKRRELLFQLSERTDLVTRQDLEKFDKDNTEPDNPAVQKASIELGKEIDEIEHELDNLKITFSAPNYKKTEYSQWDSEFNDWVDKKNFGRFTAFIQDVDNKHSLSSKALELLNDPKTSGIQPKTMAAITAARDAGGTPDYTQARKEVAHVVETMLLPRYNKEKQTELATRIKDLTNKLGPLKKKLAALETKKS